MVISDWLMVEEACHSRFTDHHSRMLLRIRLGLGKTDDLRPVLPQTALLQKLDSLEPLQDISFRHNRAGPFETAMLRHNWFPEK